MQVRFTSIKVDHDRVRDPVITGVTSRLPTVGTPFFMLAEARDTAEGVRYISTSPVTGLDGELFTTESGSVYRVEVLDAA